MDRSIGVVQRAIELIAHRRKTRARLEAMVDAVRRVESAQERKAVIAGTSTAYLGVAASIWGDVRGVIARKIEESEEHFDPLPVERAILIHAIIAELVAADLALLLGEFEGPPTPLLILHRGAKMVEAISSEAAPKLEGGSDE